MTLKEGGLRGSLRNVGVGVGVVIPDSVTTHLDVWYGMDEGSGASLADALDGSRDASLVGGYTWDTTQGYGGAAPNLNGTDGYWLSDDGTISLSSVSMCGWFKLDAIQDHSPLGVTDTPSDPETGNTFTLLNQYSQDRIIPLSVEGGNASANIEFSFTPSPDTWYFLAGTFNDAGNVEVWLWDTSSQLGSASGDIGQRVALPGDFNLYGGKARNGEWLDGLTDASGYALNTILSESDFQSIWQDTNDR